VKRRLDKDGLLGDKSEEAKKETADYHSHGDMGKGRVERMGEADCFEGAEDKVGHISPRCNIARIFSALLQKACFNKTGNPDIGLNPNV